MSRRPVRSSRSGPSVLRDADEDASVWVGSSAGRDQPAVRVGIVDDPRVEGAGSAVRRAPEGCERRLGPKDRSRARLDPDLRVQRRPSGGSARLRRACPGGSTCWRPPGPGSCSRPREAAPARGASRGSQRGGRGRSAGAAACPAACRGSASGGEWPPGRLGPPRLRAPAIPCRRFTEVDRRPANDGRRRAGEHPAGLRGRRLDSRQPRISASPATASSASFQPLPGHRRRKCPGRVSIARTMASMPVPRVRPQVVPRGGAWPT